MSFKDPGLGDRLASATRAKTATLEKFRAKPSADDPAVLKRQAERAAIQAAREARAAEREIARVTAEDAERIARLEREGRDRAAAAARQEREAIEATVEHRSEPMRRTLEPCDRGPSDRRRGPNHQMVLDAPNPSHVLSGNPKRPSLVLGPHRPVQMNNAVLHDDVLGQEMSPRLISEFSDELLPNGRIINTLRQLCFQGRQALEQVAAGDNADELAIAQHRYALNPNRSTSSAISANVAVSSTLTTLAVITSRAVRPCVLA